MILYEIHFQYVTDEEHIFNIFLSHSNFPYTICKSVTLDLSNKLTKRATTSELVKGVL